MSERPFKILFLCTTNSARSIFAEYLIRVVAPGRFESFSAGTKPSGEVNPMVLQILRDESKIDASDARSKSIDEFKGVDFDFIITICDEAKEKCPVWPGHPIVAHWSSPDPARFQGTEEEKHHQLEQIAMQIHQRLGLFCLLPIEKMERLKLETAVADIGQKHR